MKVGDIYRMKFPSIGWARVIPNPPKTRAWDGDDLEMYLVETLFTKSKWWVSWNGAPNNHRSPWLHVPNAVKPQHTND